MTCMRGCGQSGSWDRAICSSACRAARAALRGNAEKTRASWEPVARFVPGWNVDEGAICTTIFEARMQKLVFFRKYHNAAFLASPLLLREIASIL